MERPAGDLHEELHHTPAYENVWPPVERSETLAKDVFVSTHELSLRFCDGLSAGLDLCTDFMCIGHTLVGQRGNVTDMSRVMRKSFFCISENKCAVTAQLISAFVFVTYTEQKKKTKKVNTYFIHKYLQKT